MKTILLLFFVLGAGHLAAQEIDPTTGTNAPLTVSDYRLILHPQRHYYLHGDRFIYGGLAVQLFEARNPIKLLEISDADQPPPFLANRVWEQTKPDPSGWSIFSIKF
jgi:hypothetical protein